MYTITLNRKKRRLPSRVSKRSGESERFEELKWEHMVREEMGLEELFSLCSNPHRLNEMSLWQQYILDMAWHQAISVRILG